MCWMQLQRIALARAIVKDSKVIVFDEASSSLDSKSEELVHESIQQLIRERQRTVIIIAHRMSALSGVDRIVVISDGRVAETGTPAELVKNGRLFQSLGMISRSSIEQKETSH